MINRMLNVGNPAKKSFQSISFVVKYRSTRTYPVLVQEARCPRQEVPGQGLHGYTNEEMAFGLRERLACIALEPL